MADDRQSLPQQKIVVNIETWESRKKPFVEMCRKLATQRDKFTNGTDPDADLSAAAFSVHAVTQFLIEAVSSAPQLADVLHGLGTALADLDRGIIPPLLKPRPNPHGQSKPLGHEHVWAVAAAVITLLNKEGVPLTEAAKQVEQAFVPRSYPLPGRSGKSAAQAGNIGDRLANWRYRLLERGRNDPLMKAYNAAIAGAKHQANGQSSAAKVLFQILCNDLAEPPKASKVAF